VRDFTRCVSNVNVSLCKTGLKLGRKLTSLFTKHQDSQWIWVRALEHQRWAMWVGRGAPPAFCLFRACFGLGVACVSASPLQNFGRLHVQSGSTAMGIRKSQSGFAKHLTPCPFRNLFRGGQDPHDFSSPKVAILSGIWVPKTGFLIPKNQPQFQQPI
jgi:hypothetical protein